MSKYIDFNEVKAANPIAVVVEKLGLDLKKSGTSLRGTCPACESTNNRNLVVTPEKNVYYCFADGKGGDQLGLVSHINKLSLREAAEFLAGADAPKEKPKAEPSEGFKPLDYLIHDHEAVEALGFAPDVALALGIGFAPRGILKGTVAVPLRNRNGTIAGYIGLTDVDKLPPKWSL